MLSRVGGGGGGGGGGGPYEGKIAGLYDLEATLGSGHFAVVKLARHVFTGEKVAVKVIDKGKLDDVSKSHLFQEVRCMKLVQHPNVVRLYQVIDTQTKLYLILELGDGGDLYDYIMRHETGLSETLAREYFRQIVRAISYCHRLHVVHRDLKPENVVFFERQGVVKLTDFGFSNKFCPGQKLETSCGSLAYSAPEILLGDLYDPPAVDVWSLGVILYMLVCGHAPFHEANDSETLTMIMDCKYTIPPQVSASCKRLIGRMLVRQPEKRATLAEIAADPWLAAGETHDAHDTPLVAREQLSEQESAAVVQRMVAGGIASREEILDALERNEYSHITATYYLLAERKLRANRQQESVTRQGCVVVTRAGSAKVSGRSDAGAHLLQLPPGAAAAVAPHDPPPRLRKCSIVREEEDDEEGCAGAAGVAAGVGAAADARRASRSEGRLHVAARAAQRDQRPTQLADNLTKVNLEDSPGVVSAAVGPGAGAAPAGRGSFGARLVRLGERVRPRSAAERDDGKLAEAAGAPPPAPPPPRRHRLDCRRRRPRAGSCSSSDLSDDDSESRKKRSTERIDATDETATARRRDSHDDSSDSQERGAGTGADGAPGSGAGGAARVALAGGGGGGGAAGDSRGVGALGGGGGGGAGGAGGRRRRGARRETRLRESRSLNRIAEVEEAAARWTGGGGLIALCGRPLMRLLTSHRHAPAPVPAPTPPPPAPRTLQHGLC